MGILERNILLRRYNHSNHFTGKVTMSLRQSVMRISMIMMWLALVLPVPSIVNAADYPVNTVGDWADPDSSPDSLAEALQQSSDGDSVTLNGSLTGPWVNWDTSLWGTLLQTSPSNQSLTFNLNSYQLGGTNLEIITGTGTFTFNGAGTLGSTGDNFGVGINAAGQVTLNNNVSLNAAALQVGGGTATVPVIGILNLNTGSSATATSTTLTGLGSQISLNGATLDSTNFSITKGGSFSAVNASAVTVGNDLLLTDGGIFTSSGSALTVGGGIGINGVNVTETTPGTYQLTQSEFKGTGSLTFSGNNISVTNGAKADLSGFTGIGYNFGTGKSLTVEGVFSHSESAKSFQSTLQIAPGLLSASGGGTIAVSKGGKLSGVNGIDIGTGGSLTVSGGVDDTDSGKQYRSEVEVAANSDMQVTGTVKVEDGGIIGRTTSLRDINVNGLLEVNGVNTALAVASAVNANGTLTVGKTATGTLDILNGGFLQAGNAVLGDVQSATVTVNGVGTGNKRSTLATTGNMTLADNADAQLDINNGARVNVGGEAVLGNVLGKTATLNLSGAGGTDGGYAALNTADKLTVGNDGDAVVNLTAGSQINSGGATILGAGANSHVTVNLNSGTTRSDQYGWTAGGTAVTPGSYVAPLGNSYLNVTNGTLRVSGLFAMAGQDTLYGSNYGIANFGNGAELHMNGGSFYNRDVTGTIGKIELSNSAVVSGSGSIYAGELFSINGGTIAAGSRWMYDFDKNQNDKLTSIGELNIYDRDNVTTEFHGTTFRTELDRATAATYESQGRADRAVVHGDLEFDNGFTVDISRALDGKYLLIRTDGGTISGFNQKSLDSHIAAESLRLNMNGKLLEGNDRIDRTGGMFTTLENGDTEVWLTVDTTSGGNVKTWWTGNAGNAWDMTARNFDANQAGNPGNFNGEDQFLDGDIVVFDYTYVSDPAKRSVRVTTDTGNYSGDLSGVPNVHLAEVQILGGSAADKFTWESGGSIFAYDSALYSTLDQGDGQPTPSGKMVKIGAGVLEINNANEFYGGIHLGDDLNTTGGLIVLNNEKGFGTYNSLSGFQNKGLVTVHENTTIQIGTGVNEITNRFLVNENKVLTLQFNGDFSIKGNNALASGAANSGKGGGVFIGNEGRIVYLGTGNLHLSNNAGSTGGGIYTELGYTLQVPAYIDNNYASGKGGGIFAEKFFQLKDGSEISGNAAQGAGGGIYVGTMGSFDPADDIRFYIHGNTQITDNYSGGATGGGVYVDAGRELVLSTGVSTDGSVTFNGGDIWFEGNYAKAAFDPDNPTSVPPNTASAIRNSLHLANTASVAGVYDPAVLNVEGPYNTYFYDALSGDTGTQVNIKGVLADNTLLTGNTSHTLAAGQSGTSIFHADSAFYGDTTIADGATLRLENTAADDAIYGRKGSLSPVSPLANTFSIDAASRLTGQGSIAADNIVLDGIIDLDTGIFSKPAGRDGSGAVVDTGTKQGVLALEGAVTVADTAVWNLNLGTGNTTDRIDVTGTAAFTSAAAKNLELNIDDIVRGKYAIMTATGDISNYSRNKIKTNDNAEVYFTANPTLNLAKSQPKTDGTEDDLGRLKVTTYVVDGTGTNPDNLYLDIIGRNRHVTASAGGTWGYANNWTFTGYTPTGTGGTTTWSETDTGPATNVYLDGDMVTLTGGNYTLSSAVKPVDLFVTGNVSIGGAAGIRTYSTSATAAASATRGADDTTITTNPANNDYGIDGYTGKLYKTGAGTTLSFTNTVANIFTHGIEIGDTNAGGTIAFERADQISVGSGAVIDFINDGELNLVTSGVDSTISTDIHVANTKTATFNVDSGRALTLDSVISNTSGSGAIAKTGIGKLTVNGVNTFTGGTMFRAGILEIGHADAFNTFGTGNTGSIFVNDGNAKDFVVGDDYSVKNRFVIENIASNKLDIQITAGKTYTIDGVVAGAVNGGAISQIGTNASQLGFSDLGALVLSNNSANNGGGIYTESTGAIAFGGAVTLNTNKALSGSGGGIYSAGALTFNNGLTMTGNTATGDGGGIYAKSVTLTGSGTYSGNTANRGGAFFIADGTIGDHGLLSLTPGATGNLVFSGNTATGGGGAAYLGMYGDVTINAGSATQIVQFNDTLVTETTTDHALTKTGAGTLAFIGNSNNNIFHGATNINAGNFRLTQGTSYGSTVSNAGNTFTLDTAAKLTGGGTINLTGGTFVHQGIVAPDSSTALTVAAAAKYGTLTVNGDYSVTGNNTAGSYQFEFDLPAVSSPYPVSGNDSLKVSGTFTASGTDKIVFNLHNYTTGKYLLVDAGAIGLGTFTDVDGINNLNGAFDILVHGEQRTDRHQTAFMTGDMITDVVGTYTPSASDLWISTQNNNLYMYWTGADTVAGTGAGNVWQQTDNELNANWLDKAVASNAETNFESGDSVVFGDTSVFGVTPANKTITLGSNVVVTDMIVDTTGTYSFAGTNGISTTGTYIGTILDSHYSGGSGTADVPQTLTKKGTGTLTFTNTGGNTFNGGIFTEGGTITFTLANQLGTGTGAKGITFVENATLQANANSLTLGTNTPITINADKTATINTQANTLTVAGKITGNALTKTGAGTLVLTNTANDYTGTTTISAGILQANGAETLGSNVAGHSIVDNGTLNVQSTAAETLHQQISGTGIVTKSGAGTLTLDNTNTYSGATNVTTGRLIAETIGAINGTNTATVNLSAGTTLEMKLDGTGESGTLSKSITGAGSLVKSGTGSILTINTANTYTGVTTITAGRITAGIVTALGSNVNTRTVTVNSGAELEFTLTAATGTFNQVIAGAGSLIKSGTGSTLTLATANTFTGGTTLSGGGLVLGNTAAAGTYNAGISSAGRVHVTDSASTTLNVIGEYKNHFDVDAGKTWTLNTGTNAVTLGGATTGFTNNALGGAISLGNGSTMNLANTAAVTFSHNIDTAGANDIFMDGSALNITGSGNTFFNSGISGTGTVTKTSTSITQINADSAFNGTTAVNGGSFRVTDGKTYGGTATGTSFVLANGAALTGGGTIRAETMTLNGTVTPDKAVFTAANTTVATGDRFGILTLAGTVDLANTFVFNYDPGTPIASSTNTPAPYTPPATPMGDLITMTGGTAYTIQNGATINFTDLVTSGKYLIFNADQNFTLSGGTLLDGIIAGGVVKATGVLATQSPRGKFEFIWGKDGNNDVKSQIWLNVERNTLEMTWKTTGGIDNVWKSAAGSANWNSTQHNGTTYETMFNNGDYVIFTTGTGATAITVDTAGVLTSGMKFDSATDYTFSGAGITAVNTPHTTIEGQYINAAVTPVNPDGKLQKLGTGTLTFANGANTFNEGIEITAGTIAFNAANQLGDGGKGISFLNSANAKTLKLNGNADVTVSNNIIIADGNTATFETAVATTTLTVADAVTGTTGGIAKTGAGIAYLSNTGSNYTGNTAVNAGTLRAVGDGNATSLGENGASTTKQVTIATGAELELQVNAANTATLNQQITGAGKVEKIGTGEQILTNVNNAYSGGTAVTAGTLTAKHAAHSTNAGSIGSGAITLAANSILNFDIQENGSFSNTITGAGKLEKNGNNALTLSNSGNSYTGNTEIKGGRIIATNVGAVGANTAAQTVTVNSGATLEIAAAGTFAQKITGAGSIEKSAAGDLTITNTNNFTGGTTLSGGGIVLGNAAALGTYTGTGKAGQVDLIGNNTTINSGTAKTVQNRFVAANGVTGTSINATGNLTISGILAPSGGGAVVLENNSAMTLNANGGNIIFSNNKSAGLPNDITMGTASALTLTGTNNILIGSGIAGDGSITKSGSGIVQIAADSEFDGTTNIDNGTFRVLNGVKFGDSNHSAVTSFDLTRTSSTVYGILAGGGTVYADTITLAGTVRPDSSMALTPAATELQGMLHLVGNVEIKETFVFDYDPYKPIPSNTITTMPPFTLPVNPMGDLIQMTGGTGANPYEIWEHASVNFNGTATSGKYLIFLADQDITLYEQDGTPTTHLDGISSSGILKPGGTLSTASPRGEFKYIWGTTDGTTEDIFSQIWLNADRNTLEMTWADLDSDRDDNLWKSGGGGGNWKSTQINGGTWERMFNDGDYVIFNGSTANGTGKTITIGDALDIDGVLVSGMRVDSAVNYTFNGNGIVAVLSDVTIEGQYINATPTPVNPDGKLQKLGTGILMFANGVNTFSEGIEITAGTIAFERGDQLGVGSGKGIRFIGNGTLQSNDDIGSANALASDLLIDSGRTATLDSNGHLFTITSKIDETTGSGTANLIKAGMGTVRLTNTNNAWSGATNVTAGTLQAVGVETLGNNTNIRNITVQTGAELELEIAVANETLHQKITGAGSVEKTGSNTLTLDNSNDYEGGTTISGGKIVAETLNAVGKNVSSGVVNTASGTVLELKLDNTSVNESGTFEQQVTGAGSLVKSGLGTTLTLNRSDNDFTGTAEISGGRIKIGDVGAVGSNTSTGIVNMTGLGTSFEFALASNGTFNRQITGVGEVIKSGNTTVALTNTNTFSGGTQLNGGTLELTNAEALSKTDNVTGSKAGFVFVNDNATVVGIGAGSTVQNRFEVTSGKSLTIGSDGNSFTIRNNAVQGENGGAIELKNGASFTSDKAIRLTDNATNQSGGGIYAPTKTITIGGNGLNTVAEISGNTAGQNGGGIYAQAVIVSGGNTITGNEATGGRGGAAYLVGGSTTNKAVSALNATGGDITFIGNTDSTGDNSIYMNVNNVLNLRGNSNINLFDPISSNAAGISGNVINISMDGNTDIAGNVVNLYGNSSYYGNTEFDKGLLRLNNDAHFGVTSAGNSFRQKADAVLYGVGTIEAKTIDLGGVLNAGAYSPPPRVSEIKTLSFIGSTTIGELPGLGTTKMFIDLYPVAVQKADLIDVTGTLTLAGPGKTLNDLDTAAHGKFLIAQTTGGVLGYTPGGLSKDGRLIVTDFDTLMAGQVPNNYRFNVYYTVENGAKDIYLNVEIQQGTNPQDRSLVWNGLNADVIGTTTAGDFSYNNKWINDPAYNWEFPGDTDHRFLQLDRVVFDSVTDMLRVPNHYLDIRKNIEIQAHVNDTFAPGQDPGHLSKATVRDMVVLGNNMRDSEGNLDREEGTYRFTGNGINAVYDNTWYEDHHEYEGGQLFISGYGTVIFDNESNNFQRGIVMQNGAVGFGNVNQIGTDFENDPENNGITSNRGITIEGSRSYGILFTNADNMTLKTPIHIEQSDSELIIDTDGNNFGNSNITGNNTFTIAHSDIAPISGQPNGISGRGKLLKEGNGTLFLADENYYEGGTEIYKGTVAVAADNRLGKSTGSLLLNGGTLRTLGSFTTNRVTTIGSRGGTIETDTGTTLTHNGLITGTGNLTKTGTGTAVLSNDVNNFTGDIAIEAGRLIADGLGSLGTAGYSRTIGVQSELELRTSGTETLRQTLIGNGDVFKTGTNDSTLNLVNDAPQFTGRLFAETGQVHLTGDYGNTDSFRFAPGTVLSGYGKLGSRNGGVFETGSVLRPGTVVADDPNIVPIARPLTINGTLTFKPGSMFDVVITQYDDPGYDPIKMRPVSDMVIVKNGTVTIEEGAELRVAIDYWADTWTMFDFDANKSDKFTIIDAADGGSVTNQDTTFVLINDLLDLPRGVTLIHGWNDLMYQLWFKGSADGSFTDVAQTPNQNEVAEILENGILKRDPGLKDLIQILSQKEITDDMIRDILSQLAGDLRANALGMALKMPWRQPFNRIDRDMFPFVPDPCQPIRCRVQRERYKREFWGEGYGRYTTAHSDGNSYSHTGTRAGTVIGADQQISTYSLFGLAFNYSEPTMKQATGRVEMEDSEIGVYNLTKLTGTVDMKSYLGYSHQRYDLTRHVAIPKGERFESVFDTFRNKTSGDAVSMSVELLRPMCWHDYIVVSPLMALDYEHVWQKGYKEHGGITALDYDNADLERFMMRFGIDMKAELLNKLDWFGRIQYATELHSTKVPHSGSRFAAATKANSTMDIHGTGTGGSYWNVGLGLEYYFDTKRSMSCFVHYDGDFWKHEISHTGNIGLVRRW